MGLRQRNSVHTEWGLAAQNGLVGVWWGLKVSVFAVLEGYRFTCCGILEASVGGTQPLCRPAT